jgi:hypothetical protein
MCVYIFYYWRKKMKNRVLVSLVLLIVVGTSAVFAQSQDKYYLEIYNISQATLNSLERTVNQKDLTGEDKYFLVRSAAGTSSRYRNLDLTLEQAKQKLLDLDPRNTTFVNYINNTFIPAVQKTWCWSAWSFNTGYRVFYWLRRWETANAPVSSSALDGNWRIEPAGDVFIFISGNNAVFSGLYNPGGRFGSAVSKGYIKEGDQYLRNLRSTGNSIWSGQILDITYNNSNPNVATGTRWVDCTLTKDGVTFTVNAVKWIQAGVQ